MSRTLDAVLLSWPLDPWVVVPLLLTALIYVRGWLILRRRHPRWTGLRLTAFLGGLAAILIALASPVEPFASLLLHIHMVQHMLLMMLAPPLIWLGDPLLPLVRGLPLSVRSSWAAPVLRWKPLRTLFRFLTHPAVALPLFLAASWLWHAPPAYELALTSSWWHYLQHACFLGAALLFWYPVIRPFPSRPSWSPWLLLPYLIVADVANTALAALLCFAGRPLYPHYEQVPRLGGLSALEDQALAGVVMWVPGSIAFLLPLAIVGVRLMFGPKRAGAKPQAASRIPLPLVPRTPERVDLIRVPVLGQFLRWRHARLALQLPLLLLAALIVWDGFAGPTAAPMNLAGILPWVHWRGVLILGLLSVGNVFCMTCPFVLPRTLARRFLPAGRPWPRWLRGKGLAVVLLLLFLWAYEAFALWDSPWLTAWLVVAYFVAAFVTDSIFRGSAFCKYVCPLGQFNFIQSMISPFEVRARTQTVCRSCATKDCIRGRDDVPGCGLNLFVPRKVGNLDCTTCLDCVHACPHDNIGIVAVTPGSDLRHDPPRSGVGRLTRRPDVAALVIVLAFGAFSNAAGMVGPVIDWQRKCGAALGLTSPFVQATVFAILTLLILPALLVTASSLLSQVAGESGRWTQVATRYAFALVPLGAAMWAAHYGFHFLTSYASVIPVSQRLVLDAGLNLFGEPQWSCCCCGPTPGWLVRLELVVLGIGLLLSLHTAYRIAGRTHAAPRRALLAVLPWGVLLLLMFAVGVWIVLQPMQMRGTLTMTG